MVEQPEEIALVPARTQFGSGNPAGDGIVDLNKAHALTPQNRPLPREIVGRLVIMLA